MIPPLAAIFTYPFVALVLFNALSFRNALIWTILAGLLFLPTKVAWDLPLLPALTKHSIPAISALLLAILFTNTARQTERLRPRHGWLPRNWLINGLLFLAVASAFLTVVTNQEVLRYGPLTLPALRLYDGFSTVLNTIILLLPLLLARRYLASEESHAIILKAFALAGTIYSVPIVFELVMSPQLNNMVYGFFPHSWRQHLRGSGYRPIVFMQHGLVLGIFMCSAALSALAYMRHAKSHDKSLYMLMGAWLTLIMLASNTLGAALIMLALIPIILFMPRRIQLITAAVVAGAVLIYPTLRGASLIPVDRFVSVAQSISTERAASLQYRLNNEDLLLARANEKPLFGWGGYGRPRIFNERGRDISTTDGQWVIQIGKRGWAGYLSQFGLLCIPIMIFAFRTNAYQVGPATLGLCVVLTATLVDLIPNAGLTPVTWLVAGALIGRLEHTREETEVATEEGENPVSREPQLSRFAPTGQGAAHTVTPSQLARTQDRSRRNAI